MTDPAHGIRASDADRDDAARTLADATAAGRISLTEHRTRLDALYAAVTEDEVAAVTADLPADLPAYLPAGPVGRSAGPAGRGALLRMLGPYRCLLIGGQARRAGRFRMGRFCTVVAAFGGIELDLRAAELSRDELTLTIWSLLARVTVIVPAHTRVLDQVIVIGPRRTTPDDDGAAGSPVIRVRGISVAGSFHVPQVLTSLSRLSGNILFRSDNYKMVLIPHYLPPGPSFRRSSEVPIKPQPGAGTDPKVAKVSSTSRRRFLQYGVGAIGAASVARLGTKPSRAAASSASRSATARSAASTAGPGLRKYAEPVPLPGDGIVVASQVVEHEDNDMMQPFTVVP